MKLYWFTSFNPQKVRFALAELDLSYERTTVDLFKREQRKPELIALNPNGKVPVLSEDDGFSVWESNAILSYLGEREQRLWATDARGRGRALQWLFYEACSLVQHVGPLWFNSVVAPQAGFDPDQAAISRAREAVPRPLEVVDDHLLASPWMLGDRLTLVDCCYGPVLHSLAASSYDLEPHPNIRSYLDRVRERPAWKSCEFAY